MSIIKALSGVIGAVLLSACSVMPAAFERAEIQETAVQDLALVAASQDPLDDILTLEGAMARAIKYNLENRLQLMRTSLAGRNFEMVKMDMLPLLNASAGHTSRNNYDASRSYNVTQGTETTDYTTSSERKHSTFDARLVWSVLDFGVSYLAAKQEGYRFLVDDLTRKKTIITLLEQVRTQFWRAATMQKIRRELENLLVDAERTFTNLQKVRADALSPRRQVLEDIRTLAEIVQQLEKMHQIADLATIELGALINEPFDKPVSVLAPAQLPMVPDFKMDLEKMELIALMNSTDYVSEMYNVKIDQMESRKALLRLLPGLEFSYGFNYDNNRYLYNNSWTEAGVRVSYNVFQLLAADEIMAHNDAREQVALNRRLMTNVATLTKTHLSWQNYQNARKRYERSEYIGDIDAQIADLTGMARASKKVSGVEKIKTDARAMRSLMGRMQSYVDVQSSYGSFLMTLGVNPVPKNYQQLDLKQLSEAMHSFSIGVDSEALQKLTLNSPGEPVADSTL
ncbi:MAG: TolC family protein [Magnetovibrio sp.]|nr:TolC family protein [Magnetovibrio sp.]